MLPVIADGRWKIDIAYLAVGAGAVSGVSIPRGHDE